MPNFYKYIFEGLRRAKVERKIGTKKNVISPNKHIQEETANGLPKMVPVEDIETWYNGGDDYM